ncbi:DNA cytosine methyltransferase [Roseococcus sp. SDR]|uniref:DNA cytosine methyltransferase n=1 Tax=Roseococcus sp. SDR TaxID=2835532 RepID=UPI001BCEBF3F|nr:DNA cytosine methyltransferase [Roseococcus sp. SDR]MBS7789241.1 DNA cytosine methyltransferase [Roseococcus sp. SDR]MBV1844555.1 DNA cytosine methyltransferase [Roseococcus sp. SDR]
MPDGSTFRRRRQRVTIPQGQWPLDTAITVVLFAGLGGACDGLEEAGCPVAVANNHDDVALAAHAARHPHTRHVRGDIFDVDPIAATGGRPVKILWASPDCRDHSVAKGGAPRSPRVRSLAWQVCRWAGLTAPEVIFLENVREIRGWGPLVAKRCRTTGRVLKLDGTVAAKGEHVPVREQQLVRDKRHLGRIFRAWVRHLQCLGYAYQDRDLCCADYGVPTSRRRFFAVARRDGRPIAWPERTHAPRKQAAELGLQPWVAAASILDWSLPIPSIFDRPRPLAEATMRRIAEGLRRFVLDNPSPFLIPLTHTGPARIHPAEEPLRTITTAHRGEMAVIAPVLTGCGGRAGQVPPSSPEEPLGTTTAKADRVVACATLVQAGYGEREGQAPRVLDIEAPIGTQVGANKFALVAAWMVQHNGGVIGHPVPAPVSTMTTGVSQQQVGAAYLAHLRGTGTALPAEGALPTLTAGGNHVAAVAAFFTKYYGEGGTAQDCDLPMDTLTTLARFGLVTVTIEGEPYVVTDIGMRMLSPEEAAAAHELTLPKTITINGQTRPLTKSQAMRLIGNSVPKRMAKLLAEANIQHALDRRERRAA